MATRARKRPIRADLLTRAADKLDAVGEPELAAAVRQVIPEVTRDRAQENPALPMYLRKSTWESARADAVKRGRAVTDAIDAGLAAFLGGRFRPRPPKRAAHGSGQADPKGTFTATITEARRTEVIAYVEAHAEELGWSPSPAQVAVAWLEHKYGVRQRT